MVDQSVHTAGRLVENKLIGIRCKLNSQGGGGFTCLVHRERKMEIVGLIVIVRLNLWHWLMSPELISVDLNCKFHTFTWALKRTHESIGKHIWRYSFNTTVPRNHHIELLSNWGIILNLGFKLLCKLGNQPATVLSWPGLQPQSVGDQGV